MHSNHSWDGQSTIDEMCQSAVNKGISEICFTEHLAVREGDPCYGHLQMEHYNNDITRLRNFYNNKLIIKKGLEIGEPHLLKEMILPFTTNQDIDFIIGSVHNLGVYDLTVYIEGKEQLESYKAYFEELLKCVSYGDMDVIGHFDLLKRYAFDINGQYHHSDYKDLIHEILKKAISRNIGLEINTSGFRSSSMEIFPSQTILNVYKELNGKILTVGSDSHSVSMIGNNIAPVYLMLKQIGFDAVYSYNKRTPHAVKL
nr:histidinol-phosphatase HisJ family protein [Alkalibaculum sporogenes]